ncbi:aspartate, glycine, lysine and serine-rich protein [Diaphorina citri]|uniref:Aspartate, glycine, lysine and serine-rich protein n=1 Tax=Diaphorina citri TaxID=121845 RepID=A0A3Q0IZR5_DIACI|nr:aspartate, glycine, lysine and serine-rich protein [Diaphorina citri]
MSSLLNLALLSLLCVGSFASKLERLGAFTQEYGVFTYEPDWSPKKEDSWMSCALLSVTLPTNPQGQHEFNVLSYVDRTSNADLFRLTLKVEKSRVAFFVKDVLMGDVRVKQLSDGLNHYLCLAWRPADSLWQIYMDGKELKSGTIKRDTKISAVQDAVMKIGDRDLIKKGFNGNVPVPVEHIYEVWMYKPDIYEIGANNISALADIGSAPAILRRQTRAAPATEPKPVVEETLTKKNISKDDLSLSDIFDQGNLNKFKEIGSKFDPSFNSKIDSLFNRGGGGSPAPASSGGMGGLGGLSGLGNLGGFGGGGSGGMPNFGSLASAFGGNGGTGGLNLNQFLGSNGLSNFFKKSGDKSPSSPTNPNPYPYNPSYPSSNPSYPSSNPSNPPAYNPNYPPPSSGSLYPTLPKDPPPAVPLSNPTNNNNRGSVSLGDIFGMGTAGLTRGTDVAKPNNNPSNYDISFGEIFGFGGSKNKNQNPNYPDNNHRPSTGGVSLKDIFNFGTKKDESKNSYVPTYGTIGGGGMEPSKTRPKSSFDEISEGLGLSIDPDPIVRNNKPIIELNQANQKAAGSLNSQRTSSNTYTSRKPASESAYDAQRAVEEQIVQSTKVRRSRRSFNSRGTIKYQQRDGDEASFNLQNTRKDFAV